MSVKERIVCAALKTTGTNGKSTRDLIMIGVDYDFIQSHECYENFYDTESVLSEVRGFITNKKRFVDSQEAMKIALGNDQVSEARALWDIFKKAKNCKERNSIEEAINRRTKILLERGLLPEDLY